MMEIKEYVKLIYIVILAAIVLWLLKQIIMVKGKEMGMVYMISMITFALNLHNQYMNGELNCINLSLIILPVIKIMLIMTYFIVIMRFLDHPDLFMKMVEDLNKVDERKITKTIIKNISILRKYKILLSKP